MLILFAGKYAYIGLGFDQRNDAFDFGVALEDFRKQVERGKDPSLHSIPLSKPSEEYALKEGEKISVTLSGVECVVLLVCVIFFLF